MSGLIRRFVTDDSAATSIEYALIGSLLSVAIVAGAMALGSAVNSTLQGIADDNFAAPAT
jgi:pilus assembly protein Flp/PilA